MCHQKMNFLRQVTLQSVCLLMGTIQRNRKLNPGQRGDLIGYQEMSRSRTEQIKNLVDQAGEHTSWKRQWKLTPVLLPGKSHRRRSLVGRSSWGFEQLDTTERIQFHFSLSFIGEGNGNPLQCSCLENPRNGGAWWAAVHENAESDTTEAAQQQQQHTRRVQKPNNLLTVTELRSYEKKKARMVD